MIGLWAVVRYVELIQTAGIGRGCVKIRGLSVVLNSSSQVALHSTIDDHEQRSVTCITDRRVRGDRTTECDLLDPADQFAYPAFIEQTSHDPNEH
jgi:hypothetical protein